MSLGVPRAPLPCIRMSAEMQHGEYRDVVGLCREEDTVREITNERSANAFFDSWKLKRTIEESRENRTDLHLEAKAEASTLALISKRRFKNLELGLGGDVEPPHSANGTKAREQLVADLGPRAGCRFAPAVRSKPLSGDLAMPVWYRNFLRVLDETVPQGLDVFELLVRRELVEARGWKRRFGHQPSIPIDRCFAQSSHDARRTGDRES